jgi:hypothetical protein
MGNFELKQFNTNDRRSQSNKNYRRYKNCVRSILTLHKYQQRYRHSTSRLSGTVTMVLQSVRNWKLEQ